MSYNSQKSKDDVEYTTNPNNSKEGGRRKKGERGEIENK